MRRPFWLCCLRHISVPAIGLGVALLTACGLPETENRLGQGEGHAASANAGLPVVARPDTAATGAVPDAAELDERERELLAHRPAAGPSLR